MVLQGASWFEDRRAEAGYRDDNRCIECGMEVGDVWHVVWGCSAARRSPHAPPAEIFHSAAAEKGNNDCFWLRGVVPRAWHMDIIAADVPPMLRSVRVGGFFDDFPGQIYKVPVGMTFVVGTDGSGGKYGSTKSLRRIGWGFVIFTEGLVPVAWMSRSLQDRHTVPRAELSAVF